MYEEFECFHRYTVPNSTNATQVITCELHDMTSQGQHPEHIPNLSHMVEYR